MDPPRNKRVWLNRLTSSWVAMRPWSVFDTLRKATDVWHVVDVGESFARFWSTVLVVENPVGRASEPRRFGPVMVPSQVLRVVIEAPGAIGRC